MDKLINEIENFDDFQRKRKEYQKQYYEENKEKIKEKQKVANQIRSKMKMKTKFNNGEYIRKPFLKLLKYNFHLTNDGKNIY